MVHMVKYCKGEVAFTMKGEVPFTCKGGLYIVGAYDKFLHSQIFKSPLYIWKVRSPLKAMFRPLHAFLT